MPIQVPVEDSAVRGRPFQALKKAVIEGLYIRDYLNAEISLGELAEAMGMKYTEARDWLHRQGIPTARKFIDPELEKAEEANYERLKKEILPHNITR